MKKRSPSQKIFHAIIMIIVMLGACFILALSTVAFFIKNLFTKKK